MTSKSNSPRQYRLDRSHVPGLFTTLKRMGYKVIGPTVKDGAIVYDAMDSEAALPIGWTDVQEGGEYRMERRNDQALFGYNVGPRSLKNFFFPPKRKLFDARKNGDDWVIEQAAHSTQKFAYFGVRACDLKAVQIQDKVFAGKTVRNDDYCARRANACIIAVNCAQAAATCFCTSMGSGPKVTAGHDLALTEVIDSGQHFFIVEIGSEIGDSIVANLTVTEASKEEVESAEGIVDQTSRSMGRKMDTRDIKSTLYDNAEHPRWDDVASRCLTCGNCTMVCPTCFCTTVEDVTDLEGDHAERWQQWDSCFTMDFSSIHGTSVRASGKSRYRQWMTHKLASWIDQFDTSGCVGCGRCITWCPVGIDITEEVSEIQKSPPS